MVRFGAHAFVWVGAWTTESGNHAIAQAGEAGFDLIEIPLLRPAEFDAASHKAALKQAGIDAICSLALPREFHMPENPEGARKFLYGAFDAMERLEVATTLGGCTAYSLGALTGEAPRPDELQTIIEVMRDVTAEAKRRGFSMLLEACNRYETYLYNTLEDTRAAILAIGADNLKLHADTYHMNIEEEGFFTPILNAGDVLTYIHMSESHRGLVGTGTVNWEQVFAGLAAIKFSGTLTLESFAAINPDLRAATCKWRPTKQSSDELARGGLRLLKEGAARYGLM
ncbi:MAG: sugar phosphate isomerase/epimerase [Anaerolinea sp.]|nr:sugar phosphate isomerase/epimerase [Anaerolinea sp.]